MELKLTGETIPPASRGLMEVGDVLIRVDMMFNISMFPVMTFLSFVGNFLSVLVLSRKSFSVMPMSVYLRFLAVMDVGTIITGLLHRFILALSDYDYRVRNELSCQCQVYIVYVFTELSAWTLVIVTSERVLSIIKPHKVKVFCTKSKSYHIITAVVVVAVLANLPIFFLFGKQLTFPDGTLHAGFGNNYNSNSSDNSSDYNHKDTASNNMNQTSIILRPCAFRINSPSTIQAWFLTHFIKQSLLPFICIFVLNILIVVGLVKRRSTLLKCFSENSGSFNDKSRDRTLSRRSATGHNKTISRKDTSLSITLVTINAVFLICNFPIGIYQQIAHVFPGRNESPGQILIYSFLVFILYLNNTLNFVLYCVTGSRFRRELRHMFMCKL